MTLPPTCDIPSPSLPHPQTICATPYLHMTPLPTQQTNKQPLHLWPLPYIINTTHFYLSPITTYTTLFSTFSNPQIFSHTSLSVAPPQYYIYHTFYRNDPTPDRTCHALLTSTFFMSNTGVVKLVVLFIYLFLSCYWKLTMKSREGMQKEKKDLFFKLGFCPTVTIWYYTCIIF